MDSIRPQWYDSKTCGIQKNPELQSDSVMICQSMIVRLCWHALATSDLWTTISNLLFIRFAHDTYCT